MGGLLCSYFVEDRVKTSLCHAITTANTNEIKRILSKPNDSGSSSFAAPLKFIKHFCSYSKEVADGSGVDLLNSQIDSKGNTPLLLSIEAGQLESFKFLLIQLNADPKMCNYVTGLSPLHILATTKCNANIKFKSSKTSLQKSTASSKAPLISKSSPEGSKKIFSTESTASSSINDTQSHITTTITEEALREMVYLLVDKGADLNKTIQIDISSDYEQLSGLFFNPLLLAVYGLNFIVVEELLNLGCDCNYQEKSFKMSALHLACFLPNFEMVNLLLDDEMRFIKISLDQKSANGNNCLHWLAVSRCHDDIGIFKLFINYMMKRFNMSNAPSPLSSTSSTEFPTEFEKSIYMNGLDNYLKKFLDQTNNDLQTPLMLAALNNKQHLVRQILDYDATIDLKDKEGKTAYFYAKKSRSCSQLLQSFSKIKNTLPVKKSFYKTINTISSEDTNSNQIKNLSFQKDTNSIHDENKEEPTENITKNLNILNIKSVSNDLVKVI